MIGSSAAPWEKNEEQLRADAADFTWMMARFAGETAGVVDAIAVSNDGLLIAVSRPQDPGSSERLAAVVSGLTSLAAGAAGNYGLGGMKQVVVDTEGGYLLIARIGTGSVLGVVTTNDAKLANVAYEMTLFANRVGTILSPQLIVELKNTVGAGMPPRRLSGSEG
jgi:predicted regulator of Ras-like GTPase activity (Roadblock/LC7/MglB family)